MVAGYVADLLGGAIAPVPMAFAAVVGFATPLFTMRRRPVLDADRGERLAAVLTFAVVAGSFMYFLWLAAPSFLPVTNGPDVVHHLVLIHLIQGTQHLVHGDALNRYLVEMTGYTPGSHILAALVAAWSRVEAVRIVHPIAALFTALALGIMYALAFRSSGDDRRAAWQACAAPLLALIPAAYTIGGFMHFFYFAQIVAGTFALAMLLAAMAWMRVGTAVALVCWALGGAGVVLAWPVWIVPPVLATLAIAATGEGARVRMTQLAAALMPAAILLMAHALRHRGAAGILTSSGAVVAPSVDVFGAAFLACAAAGVVTAVATRQAMAVLAFAAAVLLEAAALAALSRAAGSGSSYLPFKMMFLLVPPAAVLGSTALARAADAAVVPMPRLGWMAALAPVLVAAVLLPRRIPVHRERGSITEPALAAGEWARANVPPACLDYFSSYWLTGYWMHLDLLGNPRLSDRMRTETFEFRDSVGKWIEGRGLPYAFVEDFDLVPKDARGDMAVVRRFGRAAIVSNRRPALCLETPPSLWTLTGSHER